MISVSAFRQQLAAGTYDSLLAKMYCRSGDALLPYRDRLQKLTEGYCREFSKAEADPVAVFSAPGRTEIGGNHTDHQRGKVLTGSVDLDALACAAPNHTSVVRVFSEGYGPLSVNLDSLEPSSAEYGTTVSLIRGIASCFSSLGFPVSGFDAYVTSGVPGGSGLSSSACFEVLMGVIINGLFCDEKVSLSEIAKFGQVAENTFFGKPSGLMDQMGCAIGGMIEVDFGDKENPVYHKVNFDFSSAGHALCIIDTGADHADLTDEYSAIPNEMRSAAAVLGKEVLSEVNPADFFASVPEIRKQAGDRAVLRGVHYFADSARVDAEVAALERGDFSAFLQQVTLSGFSSFMYLQNIFCTRTPQSQPVSIALAMAEHYLQGRGAVRVHGGGFAGTIQAFVPLDLVPEFCAGMDSVLGSGACRVTYIRSVGGCTVVR